MYCCTSVSHFLLLAVTVSSPISVSTPVKQVNAQLAKGSSGLLGSTPLAGKPEDLVAIAAAIVEAFSKVLGLLPPIVG